MTEVKTRPFGRIARKMLVVALLFAPAPGCGIDGELPQDVSSEQTEMGTKKTPLAADLNRWSNNM